jgi:hypothetical protein
LHSAESVDGTLTVRHSPTLPYHYPTLFQENDVTEMGLFKEKNLTPRYVAWRRVEFSTVCGRISPRIRNGIRKYFRVLTRGIGAVSL